MKITTNLPQNIRNLMDRETPFADIEFGANTIRLYWTKGGVYGPQVAAIVWRDHKLHGYTKTTGCGYCKKSAALESALDSLGLKPKQHNANNFIRYCYHIGGNFYRVPENEIELIEG